MAFVFCASGGSNTSPYETWAKAATSLQTAITQAADGDVVVLQYNAVPAGDAEVAVDTTYTFDAHCALVTASNDGGSAFTLTAMGTGTWVGNSTTNRSVTLGGAFRVYVWGLTIRIAGSATDSLLISGGDGMHYELENCYLWQGNTNTASNFRLGYGGTNDSQGYISLYNCTFRLGATGQVIGIYSKCGMVDCTLSSAGSAPTTLFSSGSNDPGGARLRATGCDFSHCAGTLVASITNTAFETFFERCKLGAGVVILATQSVANRSSGSVLISDCNSGDTHISFGYYDGLGSAVTDTGVYFTSGAAAQSWKITTSASASFMTPFTTPWIDLYNTGTSAITPYIEILRDTSAAAYKDSEVWGEFSAKTTAGSTQATSSMDRQAVNSWAAGTAGTDQAAGAGLGSWTGESGTAWSGKCDSGSSVTPAEAGYIRARIVVGLASIAGTLFVDPQIRT